MKNNTIDYDHVSGIYDKVRTGDPEMVHQLMGGVALRSTSRVLDIGCGTGNNTLLFAKSTNTTVAGLDLSYGMLSQARTKAMALTFTHAPADVLPFGDSVFDFVFMTEVVHHLPDVPTTIAEAFRVLRTPGAFCIVTQSHPQIAMRMTSRFFLGTISVDQARYPSIPQLQNYLLEKGFSNVEPREYIFKPVRLGLDYLETVERRGYSMLHKISDEEYHRGLDDLQKTMRSRECLDYAAGYTFVWAFKT
ncbi:MAG: methyltransferase domain-containing protein [Candidatus Thorarchaeota archaeon]|nr:methyltransferase domain-containing protein [Candidatus Thorarchaeota archaeon]